MGNTIQSDQPLGFLAATGLPAHVRAGQTTRQACNPLVQSTPPFDGFNLALHVGDEPAIVQQQRMALLQALAPYGAKRLVWLEQTHSTRVHVVTGQVEFSPVNADAIITRQTGVACMIMTADCLPIVLSNAAGTEVACIHAGWRGLLNGIIENTVHAMQSPPVFAWFGAAIGPGHFEVGDEVYTAFTQYHPDAAMAFTAIDASKQLEGQQVKGKYLADIYQLARQRLQQLGVHQISGGNACSYQEQSRFYSYRYSAKTGRMATFVML